MKKSKHLLVSMLILSTILLGACNLPSAGENAGNADATTVASTAGAVFTHAAETAAVALPSATTAPLATELPTNTPMPSASPLPPATNTPIPCNRAFFVKDVTYPDNTEISAGTAFTKTWRIKNNGSCAWNTNYVIFFDTGDQMGAPDSVPLAGAVNPGETVDISVNLTAPANPGSYQGNFKLRSHDNIVFGINADAQGPFWVKIVVPSPTPTPTVTTAPVHSSGSLNIDSSFTVELDEGLITPPTSDKDFWFEAVSPAEKYITSQNGAAFVDQGVTAPSKDQCSGITISFIQIPLSSSLVNHYFCYETNLGHVGKFKITAYDESVLSIDYTTWE